MGDATATATLPARALTRARAQGKIACANVLSDLYSMGIEHCDTMLMLLAVSTEMPAELRLKSTEWMMKGFTGARARARRASFVA